MATLRSRIGGSYSLYDIAAVYFDDDPDRCIYCGPVVMLPRQLLEMEVDRTYQLGIRTEVYLKR